MNSKRVIATGLVAAAAGAGAYFLFSKRFAPTRRRLSDSMREKAKITAERASNLAGRMRKNTKDALMDAAAIPATTAKSL